MKGLINEEGLTMRPRCEKRYGYRGRVAANLSIMVFW
ncbi:hypothetical protein MiAbW_01915 [Microcystis aeruginosa NIES-4325]|uniref:Uncharacterized protein n=1 Tax=Microcystis aeruginosa NIES-4325 TaxID=2569534 RepID=A0A5J4F7T6_MICAE|nr:hypothetical protein MiAbW_01915 [Microcystis aeruginosa NIES-4325]